MSIIVIFYGSLVYLLFFRFKLLPWNKATQLVTLAVGIALSTAFMVGMGNLTPKTSQAVIMGRVVDIAPQVSGEVIRVAVKQNEVIEKGAVLFEIDPTLFAAQVKELEATLALAKLRLGQFTTLAEVDAASRFEIEQTEAQIEQLEARLTGARFNLDNTIVRAPFRGRVPKLFLKPGVQASPGRSVLAFVDTKQLMIYALLDQKAFPNVKVGDPVLVSFPALPGRLFDSEVIELVTGIREGQFMITGQLETVQQQRMVRSYPLFLSLPEDFPPELRKIGFAANATVLTENAGPIALYALAMQWISTSLDAVL